MSPQVSWLFLNAHLNATTSPLYARDVPQLRQFIETGPTQEAPDGPHSRGVRLKPAIGVSLIGHRAEFDENKWPSEQAGTLLAEENRRSHPDRSQHCRDRNQWRQQHQHWQRQSKVEEPLARLRTSLHRGQYCFPAPAIRDVHPRRASSICEVSPCFSGTSLQDLAALQGRLSLSVSGLSLQSYHIGTPRHSA